MLFIDRPENSWLATLIEMAVAVCLIIILVVVALPHTIPA